ncbi:MAG TPA: hypothetical protein VF785_16200 [Gemmatimonadaceae bacterium]
MRFHKSGWLLCAILAIVWPAHSASAQVVSSSTVTTTTTPTTINSLAISAFRSGLTMAVHSAGNPGVSPLASVTLTWPQYPLASGYRVVRQTQLLTSTSTSTGQTSSTSYAGAVTVTPTALSGSTTSYTVVGLPPTWSMEFRVIALVSGLAVDSTANVTTTIPDDYISSDTMPDYASYKIWPAPTSYGFAIVLKHQCVGTGSTLLTTWAKNPAASRYRAEFEPGNSTQNAQAKLVTDTMATFSANTNLTGYAAYVRPEFIVRDWPAPGQSYYSPGHWVYFGTANLPSGLLPSICKQ